MGHRRHIPCHIPYKFRLTAQLSADIVNVGGRGYSRARLLPAL